MVWLLVALVVLHIVCGILAFGLCFGYVQGEFSEIAIEDYDSDKRKAFLVAILGFVGLSATVFAIIGSGGNPTKYGLKFR